MLASQKLYADWLKAENFIDQSIEPEFYPDSDWCKVFIVQTEKVCVKA
jgi:hypothetical protein